MTDWAIRVADRRGRDRREEVRDRRWFWPRLIQDRGKSLPFTTREPDYIPTKAEIEREKRTLLELRTSEQRHSLAIFAISP